MGGGETRETRDTRETGETWEAGGQLGKPVDMGKGNQRDWGVGRLGRLRRLKRLEETMETI